MTRAPEAHRHRDRRRALNETQALPQYAATTRIIAQEQGAGERGDGFVDGQPRGPSIIDDLYLDAIDAGTRTGLPPTPRRMTIALGGKPPVSIEPLADLTFEMPRINYVRHNTKPYRYAYGTGRPLGEQTPGWTATSLDKLDVKTAERRQWAEAGSYPGEPVFVPDPTRSGEDVGVLFSVVLDAANESSYLLVLDAQTMHERARARVPHHIPHGLDGEFYADEQG